MRIHRWSVLLAGCLFAAWPAAQRAGAQQSTIRITAGGATRNYVTSSGVEYQTDRYFQLGGTTYYGGRIAGTDDSYLYATGRAGLYTDFSYRIPVANGTYKLTLKFAETSCTRPGERVFNVTVNGAPVLTNFDILAEVPPATALDKSFLVRADGGVLDIRFTKVRGRGAVSAIVVEPSGHASPLPEPVPAPGNPPPPPAAGSGNQWYAAPNGSPHGDGSRSNPWDLATALAGPSSVRPGDTIWLRSGTYGDSRTIFHSRLKGTSAKPVIVRQYPGERATIDGGLATYSPYTWYWGFEITNSKTHRGEGRSAPECVCTYDGSTGVKLINLVLHDCSQGIGFWTPARDAEAHGNLIYYNGYQGDSRGHGHGIYVQNRNGTKTISDNIIFSQFGLGIQAYGSGSAFVENIVADGNIVFNNGAISKDGIHVDNILFAGGAGLRNITVTDNYTYHTPDENDGYSRLGWPWSDVNHNVVARGNYWIGGESVIELWNWNRATFTGNTIYGRDMLMVMLQTTGNQNPASYEWRNNRYFGSARFRLGRSNESWTAWRAAGLDRDSTYTPGAPSGVWAFVRPNKYEAGRGNIVVYNWDQRSSVEVDLSGVLQRGARYEIRDAQDFFGHPVATGTYNGGKVAIPMAGLRAADAVGGVPTSPRHTTAEFGAFVVLTR